MNISWKQNGHDKKEDIIGKPVRFQGENVGVITEVKDGKVMAKIFDEFAEKIAAIMN